MTSKQVTEQDVIAQLVMAVKLQMEINDNHWAKMVSMQKQIDSLKARVLELGGYYN